MQERKRNQAKVTFAARSVVANDLTRVLPLADAPAIGDVVLVEVLSLGKHSTIETHDGITLNIFPGVQLITVFGNRYATDQYEGYVPQQVVEECDLLSVGGVCGEVVSAHDTMAVPTRLRVLGRFVDDLDRTINVRNFGLRPQASLPHGEVILVVGSSMNAGKTTTVGTLCRSLSQTGFQVAAAKVTGTAAGKDLRYFESCGASPVLDFTLGGYPSTYMLDEQDLLDLYMRLLSHLRASQPDYIVLEVADGILQRETAMLLAMPEFRATIDHVVFAASDSLGMAYGVQMLREAGWPLRATGGLITRSPLAVREAEAVIQLPCLSLKRMMSAELIACFSAPDVAGEPLLALQRAA
ncbi:DUF1611 domain-containing protein [Candidatus Gracilibacteria bacterium]|nr:DUF1611 domain-containing protein [Candidatus Gracilibacteria bacterium]